jgi:hypothetical protein
MTNAHGRSGARRPRDGGASRRTTLSVIAAIVVALLVIGGAAALLRGGDDNGDGGGQAAATTGPSTTASPSANESTPSAPAVDSPATGSTNAAAPTGSKSAGRTYHGTGDKVLNIKKPGDPADPVLVVATYDGPSNFSLFAIDAASYETDILVNVKGNYHGTNLLDPYGTQTRRLKVQARGPWTLKIRPVSAAKTMSTRAKGSSDDVLLYTGKGGLADVSHLGKLNFIVKYYRGNDEVRLLDLAGEFHGQLRMPKGGPRLIDITADGKWAINVNP